MSSVMSRSLGLCVAALALPVAAAAQGEAPPPPAAPPSVQSPQTAGPDPDLQLIPAEPEFTLGALPTTLRMPAGKFSFRMTHRFSRPIAAGTAGEFFADFFGFDSSARIGLEIRYGIRPGTQVTFHRTNERSIQFLGQHELLAQSDARPLTVHALGAVEGRDNFSEEPSASVGAVISRRFGERGAVYAQPVVVLSVVPRSGDLIGDHHSLLLGLGARVRLGERRVYVVVEAAPRVAGYDAGAHHVSVGIERRAGGHMFQFNVSNSFGTTLRQLARGGQSNDDWYVGFNLTRKFF